MQILMKIVKNKSIYILRVIKKKNCKLAIYSWEMRKKRLRIGDLQLGLRKRIKIAVPYWEMRD